MSEKALATLKLPVTETDWFGSIGTSVFSSGDGSPKAVDYVPRYSRPAFLNLDDVGFAALEEFSHPLSRLLADTRDSGLFTLALQDAASGGADGCNTTASAKGASLSLNNSLNRHSPLVNILPDLPSSNPAQISKCYIEENA